MFADKDLFGWWRLHADHVDDSAPNTERSMPVEPRWEPMPPMRHVPGPARGDVGSSGAGVVWLNMPPVLIN